MQYRYPYADGLSHEQADDLVARLIYAFEEIRECSVDKDRQEIVIDYVEDTLVERLERLLPGMVADEAKVSVATQRTLWGNTSKSSSEKISVMDLDVLYDPAGKFLRDAAVVILEALNARFERLALQHSARLRLYPAMISLDTMRRCNYLNDFPHDLYLLSEFPHDVEVLAEVKDAPDVDPYLRTTPHMLSTAICYHCYEELAGSTLTDPLILTASGLCHRHESAWRVGRHRLNSFQMREIVFLGDADFVTGFREQLIHDVIRLFETLGLRGWLMTANDPFYFSKDADKAQQQMTMGMKYELVVDLPGGFESFSIASFNLLSQSLCTKFSITDGHGQPLHSGCVGFGMERWTYALLCTHGTEIARWPDTVLDFLGLDQGISLPVVP
jgi:seryl-tRNA synthetase